MVLEQKFKCAVNKTRGKSMNVILKVFLVLGVIFAAYSVFLIIKEGFTSAIFIFVAAAIVFFALGKYYLKMPHRIQSLTQLALTALFIFLFTIALFIIKGVFSKGDYKENAAIVLGASLKNGQPAPLLKYRLDEAVRYNKNNPSALIITAGGQNKGEDKPESSEMKNYLLSKGIDKDLIIEEDKSQNTFENLQNSKEILDLYFQGEPYKIAVITNNFHIYRALSMASALGFDAAGYPAYTDIWTLPANFVRETLSIIKNFYLNALKKRKGIDENEGN